MDKRYQVFVSSTFQDLRKERQEVIQALLELDCIPSGMELFPAADDDQWTLIKRMIDDCDYYVVIIAGRYGTIGPAGKSFTQMEYEYALSREKPTIAFVHDCPGEIKAALTESTPEGRQGLEDFKTLVHQKLCRKWSSPAELGSVVSRSIVKLIRDKPGVGWVRANVVPNQSALEEIVSLRRTVEELRSTAVKDLQRVPISANIGDFASGDDPVKLAFSQNLKGLTEFELNYIDTTWNELFVFLGRDLSLGIRSDEVGRSIAKFVSRKIPRAEHLETPSVTDEVGTRVMNQFCSLGLVERDKKREEFMFQNWGAITGVRLYWKLSEIGERTMLSMSAFRSSKEPSLIA